MACFIETLPQVLRETKDDVVKCSLFSTGPVAFFNSRMRGLPVHSEPASVVANEIRLIATAGEFGRTWITLLRVHPFCIPKVADIAIY